MAVPTTQANPTTPANPTPGNPATPADPTLPAPVQGIRDAKKRAASAHKSYDAAADALTRVVAAKTVAENAMNEALAAKIAADQDLESSFRTYRDGPDDTTA